VSPPWPPLHFGVFSVTIGGREAPLAVAGELSGEPTARRHRAQSACRRPLPSAIHL
jgi:hypothetical protein